jgi:phage terminase large subunit
MIGADISSHFKPLMEDTHRYLILCGGAGSGKTEFAARKLFCRCMMEGRHRFLILRKVRSRVRESVMEVMARVLTENKVQFQHDKTDRVFSFCGNQLLFDGLDDPEKIKSIKGITGEWLEEMTEFTREDFMQLDLRLREPGPKYHQIIGTFNPDEVQGPWIKERFFHLGVPPYCDDANAKVDVSTVKHNPIKEVREKYAAQLELLKDQDETMYKIYGLGQWAAAKGRIYNWDVVPLPDGVAFDEVWYGGDFGYSVDPVAVVKIYRKADEYWLQEILYQRNLTNADIKGELTIRGIMPSDMIVWDSAEQKSIEELRRAGLCVVGAEKGPESVKAGIDLLRSKKIHIVEGSENLIRESRTYKWKVATNGDPLPMPVKYNDHLLDAARYGITYGAFKLNPRLRSLV